MPQTDAIGFRKMTVGKVKKMGAGWFFLLDIVDLLILL